MKHVCAESYAKEKQFDDEIDDRDKLEEDSPDYHTTWAGTITGCVDRFL